MPTPNPFKFSNSDPEKHILITLSRHVFDLQFIKDSLGTKFVKEYIFSKKDSFIKRMEKIDLTYKELENSNSERDSEFAMAIVDLIRELFLKINFTDGLAFDLLKAWQNYEEIIFHSHEKYREHFLHQFQDFLMGCLFLEKLWEKQHTILQNRRFFRRWILASLFHDVGYPAETLASMQNFLSNHFFNKIPNFGVDAIKMKMFNPDEPNLKLLIKNLSLIHLFSENISLDQAHNNSYTKYELPLGEIESLFYDEINQTVDHGVAGAIFFLKTALIDLREVVTDPNTPHLTSVATEYEPYTHLIDDIFMSSAAIAGHNLRSYTYPGYTVDFSSRPIGALLIFCDELQEWDRRYMKPLAKPHAYNLTVRRWVEQFVFLDEVIHTDDFSELRILYGIKPSADKQATADFTKKMFSNLSTLLESNLSDLNKSFFMKIVIEFRIYRDETYKKRCKKNYTDYKNTFRNIKSIKYVFELNTDINSHRIGRYMINEKLSKK